MAKLLETKLPVAIGPLSPELFNRLVRVLELSLGTTDIGATVNVNESERNLNLFNTGDIIWNLATQQLQIWTGKEWVNLYKGLENGVEGISAVGTVSVSLDGDTTIVLGGITTGYGTEQWYT
tara:strand:+ start:417 stop:782 length:366 start_codon:yes stop_codon:yes gene_type:complete